MAIVSGTITGTTSVANMPAGQGQATVWSPKTVWLNSAAAGRLIEFSVDNGVNYFSPSLDSTTTTQVSVAALAPITNVRFTGALADTWGID